MKLTEIERWYAKHTILESSHAISMSLYFVYFPTACASCFPSCTQHLRSVFNQCTRTLRFALSPIGFVRSFSSQPKCRTCRVDSRWLRRCSPRKDDRTHLAYILITIIVYHAIHHLIVLVRARRSLTVLPGFLIPDFFAAFCTIHNLLFLCFCRRTF